MNRTQVAAWPWPSCLWLDKSWGQAGWNGHVGVGKATYQTVTLHMMTVKACMFLILPSNTSSFHQACHRKM